MSVYLFYLILLCTSTIQSQDLQFEGVIAYEVLSNNQPIATEKHYFKDNMIRIEYYSINESKPSFTYIHYFHGDQRDSIYKAIGPQVQHNLDSNIYNLDVYPAWTDMVESIAELPNPKQDIHGYECKGIEVSYKRPQGFSGLLNTATSKSHRQTEIRWLSNDIKYHIPKGNYFNWSKYMVAYYDPRIALKLTTIIEYDDNSIEAITKTFTKTAIEIQPGELSNSLFKPNRITNKLSSDYESQE